MKRVLQYCEDVKSGKIPAGMHLRNAVSRFERDLEVFEFREKEFHKIVRFIGKLRHFTDIHAGKPFILEPWQLFIIANIYGFYVDGKRRFETVYIEMARKNGKTALAAVLALYHLIEAGDGYPEILFAANSKDQSKIGFNLVKGYSDEYEKKVDENMRRLRRHHSDINYLNEVDENGSKYRDRYVTGTIKCLAADSNKLDGYNCNLGIVDEYHSAKNSQVRDVIRSSMGMRTSPILFTITTAGFDKTSACYELRTVCTDIIAGSKQDESFFSVIYSLDEGDDWKDPALWMKANPNLGVTVSEDFIKKQVQQAINSPSDEVGIKTKNLNIWCDSQTTWIPDDYIVAATQDLRIEDFKGETCWVGVDLASNTDLTCVAYLFHINEAYYFFVDYYVPRDTIEKNLKRIHADKDLYKQWAEKGYLNVTNGNVTDYSHISRDMAEMNVNCPIEEVYYDPYNAISWATECTDAGLALTPFSQVIANFNVPTREFERLIMKNKIFIHDNPITRYCMRNVELRYDMNGNAKPKKDSERKKIDGVIAMLQAMACQMNFESSFKGVGIY